MHDVHTAVIPPGPRRQRAELCVKIDAVQSKRTARFGSIRHNFHAVELCQDVATPEHIYRNFIRDIAPAGIAIDDHGKRPVTLVSR